eukprot:tig00020746_g13668.t1
MGKILALVNTLKDRYSKATGQTFRSRRSTRAASSDLLLSFSSALTNVMNAVTAEATKSGVNLKDASIVLSSPETPCGKQTRASDIDPSAFKICTGAATRTFDNIDNAPGAAITFPTDVSTSSFQALVNRLSASSFPSPGTGFRLVSDVYDVSATGLDGTGNAVPITKFTSGVGFRLPTSVATSGQSVSLVFYDVVGKKWETCSAATADGGAYTATCPHLTPVRPN